MPITPNDLADLSRLLDEALALPEADREPWLLRLADADRRHGEALRAMLAEHAAPAPQRALAALPALGWRTAAPRDDVAQPGHLVGPYRLVREIGRGGMGTVWLARHGAGAARPVALKLPRLAWSGALVRRMARERDIGALMQHPNIARQLDAGVDALGRPYLALEYVNGVPIDAWCAAQSLGVAQRLRLFLQVARAVAYVHRRQVLHRDLKPANVLVSADGQAHLLDFGIAKRLPETEPGDAGLTQELGRMLTPRFASPEQLCGDAVTPASDVYSLGVLLYELLTGSHPFPAQCKGAAVLYDAIQHREPTAASSRASGAAADALRGPLDDLLAKALRRDPVRRHATADLLAGEIERHLAHTAPSLWRAR